MARLAIAYLLAFAIGVFCRYFQIPAPAPPAVPGALLVAAMTLGYVLGDKVMPAKGDAKGSTTISSSAQSGTEKPAQK
jgi:XapX domain-containing protein